MKLYFWLKRHVQPIKLSCRETNCSFGALAFFCQACRWSTLQGHGEQIWSRLLQLSSCRTGHKPSSHSILGSGWKLLKDNWAGFDMIRSTPKWSTMKHRRSARGRLELKLRLVQFPNTSGKFFPFLFGWQELFKAFLMDIPLCVRCWDPHWLRWTSEKTK